MTDSEKLTQVMLDIAEVKGSIKTLSAMHTITTANVGKLEGRIWALIMMVVGAFGTAILSLVMGRAELHPVAIHAVSELFAAVMR